MLGSAIVSYVNDISQRPPLPCVLANAEAFLIGLIS